MKPQEHSDTSQGGQLPVAPIDSPLTSPELTGTVGTPVVTQKKSNKKLVVILSIIVAAIVGASAGYYLYTMQPTAAPKAVSSQMTTVTDPTVEALTTSLTDNSLSEITLTNTDDSSQATDAAATAGTVGDSVDENSF